MRSKLAAGIIAGFIAGVVFGIIMTVMHAPTPDGGSMPMMAMVAMVVKSKSLAVGWLYHLLNSAVIGALFGWFLDGRVTNYGHATRLGVAYGFIWWILGGLILMPLFLGMPAFAPLQMPMMRGVAFASLMGHITYGLMLGITFLLVRGTIPHPPWAPHGTPEHR